MNQEDILTISQDEELWFLLKENSKFEKKIKKQKQQNENVKVKSTGTVLRFLYTIILQDNLIEIDFIDANA